MLSGTPSLLGGNKAVYKMVYTATDNNGDTATAEFMITVCAADAGCEPTMPEPNPGYTPMDLMVERSGTSATITWRPGDDAASHIVAAMDPSNIVASILETAATLGGDADRYTFTGLSAGVSYTFLVVGLDANGNYMDSSTPSGVSGMAVSE